MEHRTSSQMTYCANSRRVRYEGQFVTAQGQPTESLVGSKPVLRSSGIGLPLVFDTAEFGVKIVFDRGSVFDVDLLESG
jgi:hypothetical protein